MSVYKLTKKLIDDFAYEGDGKSRDFRWDSQMKGFGVRVYPSGKKSFVISYRHAGKKRLYTIDQYGKITLDQARELAKKKFGELADDQDILDIRQSETKKNAYTVNKTFKEFIEKYAKVQNNSWAETERIFKHDVLPSIGRKALEDVTKADIISIIDAIMARGKHTMANRTFAAIRKFLNWCVSRDLIPHSPAEGLKMPAKHKSRDRVLDDHELADIWKACDKIGYPFGSLYQMLILTGQRKNEIASLKWDDIDFNEKVFVIHADKAKNDKAHYVHLSDLAIEILEKKTHKLGDYVFTSAGTRPFENFTRGTKEIKRLIKEQKGLKPRHWRTHDLRRTFASGLARLGIAPHVTEKILNHRSGIISGVAAVYNRYDYAKESGQAMADWSNHVRVILDNLNS